MDLLGSSENSRLSQDDFDSVPVSKIYDELGSEYEILNRDDHGRLKSIEWLLDSVQEHPQSTAPAEEANAITNPIFPQQLSKPRRRCKFLDIGCATGRPTVQILSDAGHAVVGIDLSPHMIEIARSYKIPNTMFEVADLRTWEPPTSTTPDIGLSSTSAEIQAYPSFDGIISCFTLSHLSYEDYCLAFDKIAYDWLRPGGCFAFGAIRGVNGRVKWMGYDVCATSFSLDENVKLLEERGFVVENAFEEEFTPKDMPNAKRKVNQFIWARKPTTGR